MRIQLPECAWLPICKRFARLFQDALEKPGFQRFMVGAGRGEPCAVLTVPAHLNLPINKHVIRTARQYPSRPISLAEFALLPLP